MYAIRSYYGLITLRFLDQLLEILEIARETEADAVIAALSASRERTSLAPPPCWVWGGRKIIGNGT